MPESDVFLPTNADYEALEGLLPDAPADFFHDPTWREIREAQCVVANAGSERQSQFYPELFRGGGEVTWGHFYIPAEGETPDEPRKRTRGMRQAPRPVPTGDERRRLLREVLRAYWGYGDFRGVQEEIIDSVLDNRDTLGLMPTGGGKSITFQVPALILSGTCLVITPLIALMKDQVSRLQHLGITAAALHADLSADEQQRVLDNAALGAYKFLYLSPERLETGRFLRRIPTLDVSMVVVDESHCISQWGYDFRPSYLRIGDFLAALKEQHPRAAIPVLALTATATRRVVKDICEKLTMKAPNVVQMSFARKNLRYIVRPTNDKYMQLLHLLAHVPGSAIVYTRNRRQTWDTASFLCDQGISAQHFHAGLPGEEKSFRQEVWQRGHVRVMVATNAFGMGIDKADVRLVVHLDMPDSLEAYFQEAGRAGRDGAEAFAVLLVDKDDFTRLSRHTAEAFPPKEYVRQVYEHLACYLSVGIGEQPEGYMTLSIEDFCQSFHHFPVRLVSALEILSRAGYIQFSLSDEWSSRVMMLLRKEQLYQQQQISPLAERVLESLLRNYTGLFADYTYIDEGRLGRDCGLSPQEVHNAFVEMNFARVLHYIPRRTTPRVRYVRPRRESQRLVLDRHVYDDLRASSEERVKAMCRYASDTTTCRAQTLLHYFDDDCAPCGRCDVCLDGKGGLPF